MPYRNPNYHRDRKRARQAAGLCRDCDNSLVPGSVYCQAHKDARKLAHQALRQQWTTQVLAAYGNACACCGETERRFLTVDHVNDDGAEHRRQISGDLYVWLIRNGFPEGFRILCFNCNMGRQRNGGVCPHEEQLRLAS